MQANLNVNHFLAGGGGGGAAAGAGVSGAQNQAK